MLCRVVPSASLVPAHGCTLSASMTPPPRTRVCALPCPFSTFLSSNTGNTPSSLSVAASYEDPLQFSRLSSFSRPLVDDAECEDGDGAASTVTTAAGSVSSASLGAAVGTVVGPASARSHTPVSGGK